MRLMLACMAFWSNVGSIIGIVTLIASGLAKTSKAMPIQQEIWHL